MLPHGAAHELLYAWDFSGKNMGVGFHFFHQGIFFQQKNQTWISHTAGKLITSQTPKYPNLIHLTTGSIAFVHHGFISPSSQALVTTIIPFCSRVRPFHLPHTNDIMKYSTFSDISLTIRPSSFIHVVANGRFSFFSWLNNILLYMYIYTHQINSVSQ